MDARDYLRSFGRSAVLMIAVVVATLGTTVAITLIQPREYQATIRLFVSTQSASSAQDLSQGTSFTREAARGFAEVVTAPLVLEPVIEALDLSETPEDLATLISASVPTSTPVINVKVTAGSAQDAANIANQIGRVFPGVVGELLPTSATDAASPVKITVIQPATAATTASAPNVTLNLIIGAVLGLALGVGAAALKTAIDTRIHGEREIHSVTRRPIIGELAYDPKASERRLIVHDAPQSPRAESFRTLRTNLQFLTAESGTQTFVITSSIAGEGKSTTAVNLAISLANSGRRVLLVDADLRRPGVANALDIEGAVGLTDILIGSVHTDEVIQRWGTDGLSVLPAGRIPPNPSELIGSERMRRLLENLEDLYDAVVIDSPPLLPVTDAAILSGYVGSTILVCAVGHTTKNQLRASLAHLANAGTDADGIVMTMVRRRGQQAYQYGYYGDGTTPAR